MTFVNALKKWFYTNGTAVGTTTSRIPLLDTNGNPIGSNTVPNIAALFGGLLTYASNDITTGDLNDITSPGGYKIVYNNVGDVLNTPFTGHAYMIVMGSGTTAMQMYVTMTNRMAFRAKTSGSGWGAWNEIPRSSVAEQGENFVVQKRIIDTTANIDELKTPSMRYGATGGNPQSAYSGTFPSGVTQIGFELEVRREGWRVVQYYYENGSASRFFKRVLSNDNTVWGAWYVYSGTAQS